MLPPDEHAEPHPNTVWTYGGYKLEGGTFATALVHFYRAEITRTNAWRGRLDVTTNWAVIATGTAISFAFAQRETHHSVIILITLLVTLFLIIEARRYRYYELWSYRVRLIETDFYAAMLVPPFQPRADWSRRLADSLLNPTFPISFWEAFGRRLRRNYALIFFVLGAAWVAKLLLTGSTVINSVDQFVARARMGVLTGWTVIIGYALFFIVMGVIGVITYNLQKATGEVLNHAASDVQDLAANMPVGEKPASSDAQSRS